MTQMVTLNDLAMGVWCAGRELLTMVDVAWPTMAVLDVIHESVYLLLVTMWVLCGFHVGFAPVLLWRCGLWVRLLMWCLPPSVLLGGGHHIWMCRSLL